jgi:hypothetical protein
MNFDKVNKKIETDLRVKILRCPNCRSILHTVLFNSKEGIYYYCCPNKICYLSTLGIRIVSAKFKNNDVFFPVFEVERNVNTKVNVND